ncbi:hypothetical protein PG994_013381 [Apiospora phragmitis]|uniref:Rhodopsin domain-containing protein n=1 Tax=Apiospora phragmitis TaxID=2905665 RepID=A0ABR1T8H0_9PEZI
MKDDYLDTTPARPPPPGVESNFDNPESHSYQLVIVIAVMTALLVLFTVGRVYTRLRVTKSWGADDPMVNSVLVRSANTLIKCAFFVFYLRLFGTKDHIRTMIWAGIVVVVAFYIAWLISYLVCAVPGKGGYLDPGYQKQMANIPTKLITAAAYVSVFSDLYILFIPMHQIPNLGLSYKRKWGISFIFLTGLLATTAGVINIIFRHNHSILDFTDITWAGQYVRKLLGGLRLVFFPDQIRIDNTKTRNPSLCECNLGMVGLCMPVLLALFVGRITAFGQSLGSWVNLRKAQRHGAGDSASNLSPSDGNESSPESAPEIISKQISDPKLGGMRKFICNLHRSRAQNSELDIRNNTTVMSTFNDLTSADLSYHVQLKALHPTQSANSRSKKGEKQGYLEKLR